MLNLYWLQDCFQGKHNKSIVIFYLVNGVKLIEEYDTEQEASNRVMDVDKLMDKAGMGGGLLQKDTLSDFLLGSLLSITIGMILYLVFNELLVELKENFNKFSLYGLLIGIILMLIGVILW